MIKKLIKLHFESQSKLFKSTTIKTENTNINVNELINDSYWNLAYIKNKNINIQEEWNNIKKIMGNYNKLPILYISNNLNIEEKEMLKYNFQKKYCDSFLVFENIEEFPIYEPKVELKVYRVDESLKEEFIETVLQGFCGGEEEPYEGLEDGYRKQLEYSFENANQNEEMQIKHYLGKVNDKCVSTATAIYEGYCAIIYNVTTLKEFQKMNICKRMMTMVANDLQKRDVKNMCVITEAGYYTEEIYKKLGFKEIAKGIAYEERTEDK